ncbi:MAG TPA: M28 family peptidase [Pyrinomonadaceae bacterium]
MPSFEWKSNQRRIVALAVFVALPLLVCACPKNDPPPINPRITISTSRPVSKSDPLPTSFNGERAMAHVRKQVEIGPRPPDTPALAKTRSYIIAELKSYGLNVTTDEFTTATPLGEKKMANIVAELPGETNKLILIASHYDTKLYDDMHFVGANDPGASVGVLLELGRVLAAAKEKPKLTYRLVFFDGEESFCEGWSECEKPDAPDNTYGSRHYVAQLREHNELENTRALILLDMVGYKKLELGRDTLSTRWLQDIVWQTGRELGHTKIFVDRAEGVGGDDHEPFLKAGVPSVDLIQLNGYPYWHRPDDTIDKLSAQSMKIVGDTVIASLPRIVAKVTK